MSSPAGSVDVIVPCYCYAQYLRECVRSVLTQGIPDLRVLIIDDASPDHTREIANDLAREDPRVTLLHHSANRGHIASYNEGIEWASADYMLVLSADDYLLPGALRRVSDLMDAHPEVGFTFGKTVDLTEGGTAGRTHTAPNSTITAAIHDAPWCILSGIDFFKLIDSAGSANIVRTPTAVVRTRLQKRLGGYRTELPHSGDLEMWLRLATHASVGVIGSYQAAYRMHCNNMNLAYFRNGNLADLKQRKAAFDCISETLNPGIPHEEYQQLLRSLQRHLGVEALRYASTAFNDDDPDLSAQLSAFAITANPRIRRSVRWTALRCQRLLGVRLSRAVTPAARKMHHFALRKTLG